jgi:hypothetical protein
LQLLQGLFYVRKKRLFALKFPCIVQKTIIIAEEFTVAAIFTFIMLIVNFYRVNSK